MKKIILSMVLLAALVCGNVSLSRAAVIITDDGTAALSTLTNFTVGFRFTVGPDDLLVTDLGVWDNGADGLTNAHPVGLWEVSSSTLLGSITVPSGTSATLIGEFRYVPLPSSITLSSGVTYVIGAFYGSPNNDASHQAVNGGSATSPSFSSDATNYLAYNTSGGTLTMPAAFANRPADSAYVGPNLQYTVVPEPSTSATLLLGIGLMVWMLRGSGKRGSRGIPSYRMNFLAK